MVAIGQAHGKCINMISKIHKFKTILSTIEKMNRMYPFDANDIVSWAKICSRQELPIKRSLEGLHGAPSSFD